LIGFSQQSLTMNPETRSTAMTTQVAQVDAARCTGCGRCISACDLRLFSFETHQWKKRSVMHDAQLCSACGECAARCPVHAVTLVEKVVPAAAVVSGGSGHLE
jgi:ferredoxin